MPWISGKSLIYLAVGVAVLLVGLNSIRSERPAGNGASAGNKAAQEVAAGEQFEISSGGRKLVVDVSGAVRHPGVYRFSQGARVVDAIRRAGGLTQGSSVASINRAATLSDGQQVVVPTQADMVSSPGESSVDGPGPQISVSLGAATKEQLEEIDGIGPVTAEKILEFRDSEGGLASVEDLDQVSGIGPVTMEALRAALAP